MKSKENSSYSQKSPSPKLRDFVDSYWESTNNTVRPLKRTIFPDGLFKVVIILVDEKIIAFFLTGLWTKETDITIPAKATVYGIKFKILAPEYIFQHEVASLLQTQRMLDHDFWNINNFKFNNIKDFRKRIEPIIINKLSQSKIIADKKLKLSQLIYQSKGNILAKDLADQVNWSNRQINRYLNKYLGVSLKTYLNIQKIYTSYIQIREGNFSSNEKYHDQSHFIKEIKKHTGRTPKKLHKEQNDRFIQLKNIKI
jgi:AraC-like DNA-binding protein